MMHVIGCDTLDRDSLLEALAASDQVRRVGWKFAVDKQRPGEFEWEEKPHYEFGLSIINTDLGFARLRYQYRGAWSGQWPLPLPTSFRLELDTEWQLNPDLEFTDLVDPATYTEP